MTEAFEIEHLVKLFEPIRKNDDSDSDSESIPQTVQNNEIKPNETKKNPYTKIEPTSKKETEEIYESEELLSGDEPPTDWKKTPKWDISYRQQVTASDVFLQMGAKTPSTASCEDMIVTIDLPGEKMQNMDIKIVPKELQVSSPNFSLSIPLPQPVHPQKGNAKWDKDQEKLTITLKMEREFDFINF